MALTENTFDDDEDNENVGGELIEDAPKVEPDRSEGEHYRRCAPTFEQSKIIVQLTLQPAPTMNEREVLISVGKIGGFPLGRVVRFSDLQLPPILSELISQVQTSENLNLCLTSPQTLQTRNRTLTPPSPSKPSSSPLGNQLSLF